MPPSLKYWYISLFTISCPSYDPSKSACFCSCRECRSTSSTMPLMFMASQSMFISLPSSVTKQPKSASYFNCCVGRVRWGDKGTGWGDALNLMYKLLGAADVRGSSSVVMAMPSARAPGGSRVRKSRAALARGEKGLKRVVTWVMKRVIIFGDLGRGSGGLGRFGSGGVGFGPCGRGRVGRARGGGGRGMLGGGGDEGGSARRESFKFSNWRLRRAGRLVAPGVRGPGVVARLARTFLHHSRSPTGRDSWPVGWGSIWMTLRFTFSQPKPSRRQLHHFRSPPRQNVVVL